MAWYGGAEQQFLELSNLPIKCRVLKTKLNQLPRYPPPPPPSSPHRGEKPKALPSSRALELRAAAPAGLDCRGLGGGQRVPAVPVPNYSTPRRAKTKSLFF